MGNYRELARINLAKDLQEKIEATKLTLSKLRGHITKVERNAVTAKAEVDTAVETMTRQLIHRQSELHDQIDQICQSQLRSLNENLEIMCVRLGSLQGLLENVEFVDGSQLGNVHVPSSSGIVNPISNLEVKTDTTLLCQAIVKWGSVSSTTSGGMNDLSGPATDAFLYKSDSKGSGSVISNTASWKLEKSGVPGSLPCRNRDAIAENQNGQKDCEIEQWLSCMKIQCGFNSSGVGDDFEFLSVGETLPKYTDDTQDNGPGIRGNSLEDEEKPCDGAEDGSSIVCVETDYMNGDINDEDEMYKWLKPKKKRMGPSFSDESIDVCLRETASLCDISNFKRNEKNNNCQKRNRLDFPCLREDPSSWVVKRKSNGNQVSSCRSELCLQVGQKEIIPPQYALPYPFWLRKQ